MITGLDSVKDTYRFLVYGAAKTGKTTFALNMAKLGFNVIVLDGDRGQAALRKQITPDAHWIKNILWLDLADKRIKIGEQNIDIHYNTEVNRLLNGVYTFNVTKQIPANAKDLKPDPDDVCIALDLRALDKDTIIVLDSWTALASSIEDEYPNESPLFKTTSAGQDTRKAYAYRRTIASAVLKNLLELNTSCIVIGHELFEPTKVDDKDNPVMGKVILQSVSKSHGSTLLKQFSEVLYLSINTSHQRSITVIPTSVGVYDVVASSTIFKDANQKEIKEEVLNKVLKEKMGIEITNPNQFTDKSVAVFHQGKRYSVAEFENQNK